MIIKLPGTEIILPGEECFIAPDATLIGAVTLHRMASVWFGAILRAESSPIVLGESSNVQDGAVIHTDDRGGVTIGACVTVAHRAVLHSCTVGDHSLVGINAVVLNGASIGSYSVIAANSLVTEKAVIPDHSLVMGSPARVVRQVGDRELEGIEHAWRHYIGLIEMYRKAVAQ